LPPVLWIHRDLWARSVGKAPLAEQIIRPGVTRVSSAMMILPSTMALCRRQVVNQAYSQRLEQEAQDGRYRAAHPATSLPLAVALLGQCGPSDLLGQHGA